MYLVFPISWQNKGQRWACFLISRRPTTTRKTSRCKNNRILDLQSQVTRKKNGTPIYLSSTTAWLGFPHFGNVQWKLDFKGMNKKMNAANVLFCMLNIYMIYGSFLIFDSKSSKSIKKECLLCTIFSIYCYLILSATQQWIIIYRPH